MLPIFRIAACLAGTALLLGATPMLPVAQTLAHPIVRGAAGPHARVQVVLTRPPEMPRGNFSGVARAGGRKIALPGNPDEPEGFFHLDPTAVLFTPVDRSRRNGIVVLYRSSRIGPLHGTEHRALVYRIEPRRAVRLPTQERRLDGTRDAATARLRLRSRADDGA